MSMISTQPPNGPHQFLGRLGPLIRYVFTFLESATQEAYRYNDERGPRAINPWFFTHHVRLEVWWKLEELRRTGKLDFMLATKSMSGLEVAFDGLRVKVLRPGEDDDSLPQAKSGQQKLFYKANIFTGGDESFFIIKNLVLLWDFDHGDRSISLSLICPNDDGSTFWSISVPHPASMQQPPPPEPEPKADDLPYELEKPEKEKGAVEEGEDGGGDE